MSELATRSLGDLRLLVGPGGDAESAPPVTIDKAGVYDLPDDVYHQDPVPGGSLSSSGVRKLLPPSCPALYRYWADHGQAPRAQFDFGHAAHRMVLGSGPKLVVVEADDWRTKAARAERDKAHADGAVPMLAADYDQVEAMAAALRQHPIASALFSPERGTPEQSLFWVDDETGVWCRARLDWLPHFTVLDRAGHPTAGRGYPGRLIVPDYKTTSSAAPDQIQRSIYTYGYHIQAAFYLAGVRALFPHLADPQFVFVFQEKTPPYLVTVAQPDQTALHIGRLLIREAIDLYAKCVDTGRWPGYSDDVALIALPAWIERQYQGDTW